MAQRVENIAGDRERHGGGTEMAETSFAQNEPNFCHRGRSCETKPIPGGAGWVEAQGTRGVEENRAKRSQFAPDWPDGSELQVPPLTGRNLRNKPNLAEARTDANR